MIGSLLDKLKSGAGAQVSPRQSLLAFLKQFNCKYEHTKTNENIDEYYFSYQHGNFIAFVYQNEQVVEVIFPRVFETTIEHLNLVRFACNRLNMDAISLKYSYRIDSEENKIFADISFCDAMLRAENFASNLEQCFMGQRDFDECFDNLVLKSQERETTDVEFHASQGNRELVLMREQELLVEQASNLPFRNKVGERFTLEQLLMRWLGYEQVEYKSLYVVTSTVATTTSSEAIAQFNLATVLIEGSEGNAHFIHDSAVAVVRYSVPAGSDSSVHTLTLNFMQEGSDEHTLYYRVEATMATEPVSIHHSIHSRDKQATPSSLSMLLATDVQPDEKRRQQFDYMWKDAQIKLRENKIDELSPKQQLMCGVTDANLASCLYWGRLHMCQSRYYQALFYLENAYNALRGSFFMLKDHNKKQFRELCYHIGFCYAELQLYEKAFFYLDLICDVGRIDYVMAFVNVLVNAGDVRVFSEIERFVADVREQYDDEEEIPEKVQKLLNFLYRRRAMAFMVFGALDRAEQEFKKMLDDPDNRDFAISKLAAIEERRKEEQAPNATAGGELPPPFNPPARQ